MGVVSACAWEENTWVWSVCLHMGGGCVGVVSVCAWEDAWVHVWSVRVHGRGIVDIINSKLTYKHYIYV